MPALQVRVVSHVIVFYYGMRAQCPTIFSLSRPDRQAVWKMEEPSYSTATNFSLSDIARRLIYAQSSLCASFIYLICLSLTMRHPRASRRSVIKPCALPSIFLRLRLRSHRLSNFTSATCAPSAFLSRICGDCVNFNE